MAVLTTPVLEIEYTDEGAGTPVVLVHDWPDAARGWDAVRTGLLDAGSRVVVPSLRGSGGTRFRDGATVRDGTAPALAQLASPIFEWIEAFSNPVRRHTSPDMLAPREFETLYTTAFSAA